MGQLVVVVGNSGVGKTTLVNALAELAPFAVAREQHEERPYQALMKADPQRYALANQLDYLLLRAEQERAIRQSSATGLVDGGLDLDFHGFTRLFHQHGYLTDAEYDLCRRLYDQLRAGLGPPDLIIRLVAPVGVIAERYAQRGRTIEITQMADLLALGQLVDAWLDSLPSEACLTIDAATDDVLHRPQLDRLLAQVRERVRGLETTGGTSP